MTSDDGTFAGVARQLALDICGAATWSHGRCNWIGSEPLAAAHSLGARASCAALGPDLYNGTSGVALFLAEAARFGDAGVRAAALGAIRHALRHAGGAGDGLYLGAPGIAWAAMRVGFALDEEEILLGARTTLRAWWRERDGVAGSYDLLGGIAGALAGLVALSEAIDDAWALDAALELGEQLLASAEITDIGWSWRSKRSRYNLCGFSHGAAGIGHALLELHALTGDDRLRRAGYGAFRYERTWVANRAGSWPDLREITVRSAWDVPQAMSATWCNGPPGIALSRVRARELRDREAGPDDAGSALAATRAAVDAARVETKDFSLCHGAAGIGDVLLRAGEPGLASDLGRLGIERHHAADEPFPCGVGSGSTPGLMLGLAGIGLFYLRLGDARTPTPLLIHRPTSASLTRAARVT